ncbi:hypothetical protein IWQ60_005225 [Tieghemiomyces parasiticus]|uniref:Uncharacterized protein n=1 Tax=Tieghemiomyces parasiticus TaxID=78921 RepID=A0A9W8DYF6_9FUNG|nr:hypothetical protein IWQ60_005225 [Tieghemiomyces parasiticus]
MLKRVSDSYNSYYGTSAKKTRKSVDSDSDSETETRKNPNRPLSSSGDDDSVHSSDRSESDRDEAVEDEEDQCDSSNGEDSSDNEDDTTAQEIIRFLKAKVAAQGSDSADEDEDEDSSDENDDSDEGASDENDEGVSDMASEDQGSDSEEDSDNFQLTYQCGLCPDTVLLNEKIAESHVRGKKHRRRVHEHERANNLELTDFDAIDAELAEDEKASLASNGEEPNTIDTMSSEQVMEGVKKVVGVARAADVDEEMVVVADVDLAGVAVEAGVAGLEGVAAGAMVGVAHAVDLVVGEAEVASAVVDAATS